MKDLKMLIKNISKKYIFFFSITIFYSLAECAQRLMTVAQLESNYFTLQKQFNAMQSSLDLVATHLELDEKIDALTQKLKSHQTYLENRLLALNRGLSLVNKRLCLRVAILEQENRINSATSDQYSLLIQAQGARITTLEAIVVSLQSDIVSLKTKLGEGFQNSSRTS